MQFKVDINLDWSDLDLFGHINNIAYFRFIQQARVTALESLGIQTQIAGKHSFIVAASACEFMKALQYPGSVQVSTSFVKAGSSSVTMLYDIIDQNNHVCAKAKDVIVFFNYHTQTKNSVPNAVLAVTDLTL